MARRRADETRRELIQAANHIVKVQGAARMTLDAVAQQAGVSKGGLIYHFPSKEALIQAQVRALMEAFEQRIDEAMAADNDPDERGRFLRGYVRANANSPKEELEIVGGLQAAMAERIGDILQEYVEDCHRLRERATNDGCDPVTAMIVVAASDALWSNELLGSPLIQEPMHTRMVERLIQMIDEARLPG